MWVFEKFSGESVCILVLGACIEKQTAVKSSASVYLEVNQTHFNIYLKCFNSSIMTCKYTTNGCVYVVIQNHLRAEEVQSGINIYIYF